MTLAHPYSPSQWQEGAICNQEAKDDKCWSSAVFVLCMQSGTLAHGTVTVIYRTGLLTSLTINNPYGHAQRLLSSMILGRVKLAINTNHQITVQS